MLGQTSLIIAASTGNVDIVKILLGHRANVYIKDDDGVSALYIACLKGHLEIAKLIIDADADVDVQTKTGYTPLMIATIHNRLEIVQLLLNSEADTSVRDNTGQRALNFALDKRHNKLIELLVMHDKVEESDSDKTNNFSQQGNSDKTHATSDPSSPQQTSHTRHCPNSPTPSTCSNITAVNVHIPSVSPNKASVGGSLAKKLSFNLMDDSMKQISTSIKMNPMNAGSRPHSFNLNDQHNCEIRGALSPIKTSNGSSLTSHSGSSKSPLTLNLSPELRSNKLASLSKSTSFNLQDSPPPPLNNNYTTSTTPRVGPFSRSFNLQDSTSYSSSDSTQQTPRRINSQNTLLPAISPSVNNMSPRSATSGDRAHSPALSVGSLGSHNTPHGLNTLSSNSADKNSSFDSHMDRYSNYNSVHLSDVQSKSPFLAPINTSSSAPYTSTHSTPQSSSSATHKTSSPKNKIMTALVESNLIRPAISPENVTSLSVPIMTPETIKPLTMTPQIQHNIDIADKKSSRSPKSADKNSRQPQQPMSLREQILYQEVATMPQTRKLEPTTIEKIRAENGGSPTMVLLAPIPSRSSTQFNETTKQITALRGISKSPRQERDLCDLPTKSNSSSPVPLLNLQSPVTPSQQRTLNATGATHDVSVRSGSSSDSTNSHQSSSSSTPKSPHLPPANGSNLMHHPSSRTLLSFQTIENEANGEHKHKPTKVPADNYDSYENNTSKSRFDVLLPVSTNANSMMPPRTSSANKSVKRLDNKSLSMSDVTQNVIPLVTGLFGGTRK
eukprot:gene25289-31727_t